MKTVLYRKGVDPFTATSQEQVDYHLTQGWFTDPKQLEESKKVIAPPTPSIVGKNDQDKRIKELEALLAAKTADTPAGGSDERIKEQEEIVVAKDQQIVDMQSDFEELTGQMTATIEELKKQIPEKKK